MFLGRLRRIRRNATLAARKGDTAASNRAVELIGKHIGMFVDRKEIQINMLDDSDEYLARILAIVEGKVIDNEPAALPAPEDGSKYGGG